METMRAKTFLLAAILFVSLSRYAEASCELKKGNSAVCTGVEDAKHLEGYKLISLKATPVDKTLTWAPFKEMNKLKNLDLSGGNLKTIKPGTFKIMTNLRNLKLSDNSIETLELTSLEGLDNLQTLDLRRNSISELPAALATVLSLKSLKISENPLACTCATLRVRDELLSNGVKLSEKISCAEPAHLKGTPLLRPDAEVICMFEEADGEMMADEAGSGEYVPDEGFDDIGSGELPADIRPEFDVQSRILEDEELLVPASASKLGSHSKFTSSSEDAANSSASSASSSDSVSHESHTDDFVFDTIDEAETGAGSGLREVEWPETGVWDEGSGDGSGYGLGVDFGNEEWEPETEAPRVIPHPETTTVEVPTSSSLSWSDIFWHSISGEPFVSTVRNDVEPNLTEEQFIEVESKDTVDPEEAPVVTEEIAKSEVPTLNRGIELPEVPKTEVEELDTVSEKLPAAGTTSDSGSNGTVAESERVIDGAAGDAKADGDPDVSEGAVTQPKKGTGSYVVLAVLLVVLVVLIGFAAYKGNFCKKRTTTEDPEQGRELKDMQKSLLEDGKGVQAKIATNGNAESAPLVGSPPEPWTSPDESRPWKDSKVPKTEPDNKYTVAPPTTDSEPVKPPRKSLPPSDEQNGHYEPKSQPMSTFAPRNQGNPTVTPPNSPTSVMNENNASPPLSPNAQRVKITLQENPDSVPKTPILITRTKAGENIVKRP